nr:membrane protein [Nocardia sp. BMG51109]
MYRWGAITAFGVILGYAAVLLADARHFFTDDTESQYTPLWVMLGRYLREGTFPVLIPEQWMTGNYTMEEAGLFNPPQLLIDLIAPSVDNLAVYATVVKLIFAIIAALGVYRVCLAYGGRVQWAAVAGVAFPLSGWFLFFDQASWMTALTGTAWMVHAWAAAVRYSRGKGGPVPVFVFLYLGISVEYVFPAVESALMLVSVAVGELVYQRKWQPVARLTAVAACAGLAGLMTYLPSMLSAKVSWRGTSQINNDQFLTVPWSESLNASLPSAVPALNSWWGYIQPLPMTYIAWFLIPALAFIDWGRARAAWRELTAVALFAVIFLMWAAGPGTVGPLRWPARVLPMLALGLLVLVCVLLGRFGTTANWRGRGIAAAVLIGLLWVRTFSADPHNVWWHVLSAVAVAALGAAVVWLARTRGATAAALATVAAMLPIAYAQVENIQPNLMSWQLPANRSDAKAAFPEFGGVTLQLGDRGLLQPGDRSLDGAYGSLAFGNYAKDVEQNYVNGYTPNGHYWFGDMLCMRWDSSVCPDAYRRLFTPEPTTGRTLADLMKLDRIVLQRAMFPDAGNQPPPEGWTFVDVPGHERYIWVLERVGGPVSTVNGRIADAHDVTATSTSESETSSKLRVSSPEGGRVVFARLGWPGYRVSLNGRQIPFTTVAKSFVAVDIPAGTENGALEVTWRPPGWKIGSGTAILGLIGVGALQWAYVRSRRRDAAGPDEPAKRPLEEPVS